MCNDRQHQKIRSLANHCFDLRFQRPRVEQIKAAMMSVCFKEKIPIKPEALTELINGCGQDVRQVAASHDPHPDLHPSITSIPCTPFCRCCTTSPW